MRTWFFQGSGRRRFLTLSGLAVVVALLGVQAAGGASSAPRVVSAQRHVSRAAAPDPSSLTPSNQPALDAAADDARALVPSTFFAGVVVDDDANVVDVYMAHAPLSVIDQLQAMHPGLYVIHNAAPSARSDVLARLSSLDVPALAARGVAVVSWGPTEDGRMQIGVSSALSTAQTVLAQLFGSQSLSVYPTSPIYKTTYRYNDVSPWNGGDFIYHNGGFNPSCTTGIPVHGSGTNYLITAAHCWDGLGGGDGLYTTVYNGYIQTNGTVYSGSSQTFIGKVMHIDNNANGATTLDSGLIQAPSSVDDFDAGWNSAGKAIEIGEAHNNVGDQVCTSGAFNGQACSIVISAMDQSISSPNNRGGTYTTNHLAIAANPNNSSAVATETGDSGGPVYSYSGSNLQVRGMIDAGQTTVSCTSVPTGMTNEICLHKVFFVEQFWIDQEWGVTPNS
jgi:Trypsin